MGTKAVVIVDMLNDFLDRVDGYVPKLPVPGSKALVENIGKIRDAAYENKILVVYDNDAHAADDPEFQAWGKHAVKGTYGAQVVDKLLPKKGDLVLEKITLSMFSNGSADRLLREHGIEELIFTGVATEYCVREAAIDGIAKGYRVSVVVDAIAGVDAKPGDQYRALLEMGSRGVKLVYTTQVLEDMLRR